MAFIKLRCEYWCVCFVIHRASSKKCIMQFAFLPCILVLNSQMDAKYHLRGILLFDVGWLPQCLRSSWETISGLDSGHCHRSPRGTVKDKSRHRFFLYTCQDPVGASCSRFCCKLYVFEQTTFTLWFYSFVKMMIKTIFVCTSIEIRCQILDACVVCWIVLTWDINMRWFHLSLIIDSNWVCWLFYS